VFRVLSLAIPFYALIAVTTSVAQSFRRIDYQQAIKNILNPLLNILFVSSAFIFGYRLSGALLAFVLAGLCTAALGMYVVWRVFPAIISDIKPIYEYKSLLAYSVPVFLAGLATLMLTKVDRIMLGYFCRVEDVGIYSAAAMVAFKLPIFINSFGVIFNPIISYLHRQNLIEQISRIYQVVTKWTFTLTLPFFLLIVLFAPQIMSFFGQDFTLGTGSLLALSLSQLLNVSVGPVNFLLIMTGRQNLAFFNTIVLSLLNIIFNFVLIPRYGILGAAIATGSSICLYNLLSLLEVYVIYKMYPYNLSYWKPMTAGIFAYISVVILQALLKSEGTLWLIYVLVFLIIYPFFIWVLKVDEYDMILFRAARDRSQARPASCSLTSQGS
jgi:O-antigen/teichoic acid export membrane protein